MLTPPVVTMNADAGLQNQQINNLRGSRPVESVLPQTTVELQPASQSTSRNNIAALTAQLQLAKNLYVLTEALAEILDMPRAEGESAAQHIDRLLERLRSLPQGERKVIEAQLNLALQGATLKALAAALRNPSGPDAARLAVMFEVAQYRERDLATRAAVSSYRQNSGADAPSAPTKYTALQSPSTNVPAGKSPDSITSIARENTPPVPVRTRGETAQRGVLNQIETAIQTIKATLQRATGTREIATSLPSGSGSAPENGTNAQKSSNADVFEGLSPSSIRAGTPAVASSVQSAQAASVPGAQQAGTHEGEDNSDMAKVTAGSEQQEPPTGRTDNESRPETRRIPVQTAPELPAKETIKGDALSSLLTAVSGPSRGTAPSVPTQMLLPETLVQEDQPDSDMTGDTADLLRPAGSETSAERTSVPPDARLAYSITTTDLARNAGLRPEQQAVQTSAAMALILGREAIGLPYVNYLPAPDEPEFPAQHSGHSSSGGEEELPDENSCDAEEQEEDVDTSDGNDVMPEDGTDEMRGAEAFYQRLSNW